MRMKYIINMKRGREQPVRRKNRVGNEWRKEREGGGDNWIRVARIQNKMTDYREIRYIFDIHGNYWLFLSDIWQHVIQQRSTSLDTTSDWIHSSHTMWVYCNYEITVVFFLSIGINGYHHPSSDSFYEWACNVSYSLAFRILLWKWFILLRKFILPSILCSISNLISV